MLRSFLVNTKYFLITSSIALSSVYGYCYYRCRKNERDYLAAINADTLKDASRLSNESFGISWGFQADDTVMNSIDSGDLFFIKYDCLETLSPLEMVKCYRLTIPLLDEEYHSIGVAYRDENGLMAYTSEFGKNRLMRYSQLVSLPYIKQLMVQKTKENVHNKLVKLLQEDRAFEQVYNEPAVEGVKKGGESKGQSLVLGQKGENMSGQILEVIRPSEDSFKFVNRVLGRLDLIEEGEQIVDLRELLTNEKQVNIRTETNKMLRSL